MPTLGVFLGDILTLGNSEIERELVPRLFCNPTAIPILAIRQEAFRELVPLTRAITDTSGATAIRVHLVIKEVSLCPLMAWLGRVWKWGA